MGGLSRYGRRKEIQANELLVELQASCRAEMQLHTPRVDQEAQRTGLQALADRYTACTPGGGGGGDGGGPSPASLLNSHFTAFFDTSRDQLVTGAALVLLGHCVAQHWALSPHGLFSESPYKFLIAYLPAAILPLKNNGF